MPELTFPPWRPPSPTHSLQILELSLYERVINGKDVNISKKEADEVRDGNWEKFLQNNTARKYLNQMEKLKELQMSHDEFEYLTTQEFANKARRGLRVTSYEFCQ